MPKKNYGKTQDRIPEADGQPSGPKNEQNRPQWWLPVLLKAGLLAGLALLGWMSKQIYDHNGRLSDIEAQLRSQAADLKEIKGLVAPRRLEQASLNAASPTAASEVKAAISDADEIGSKIELDVIRESGTRFIQAGRESSAAWEAALYCLNYRSVINASLIPKVPSPEPLVEKTAAQRYTLSFRPS